MFLHSLCVSASLAAAAVERREGLKGETTAAAARTRQSGSENLQL